MDYEFYVGLLRKKGLFNQQETLIPESRGEKVEDKQPHTHTHARGYTHTNTSDNNE